MTGVIAAKLASLGIVLPAAPAPVANYLPYVIAGKLVFISGQISKDTTGHLLTGKVGSGAKSVEEGKTAAHASILNLLAQLQAATDNNLDKVKRIVRINIHVNSTSDFTDQAAVGNAASDVLVNVFGDKGRHARCALGAGQLPLNSTTEIDAVVELE